MVEWLTNPTEWECAPDDIELISIIDNDVFVYRFRVLDSRCGSGQWIAGLADDLFTAIFSPSLPHLRRSMLSGC